MEINREVYLALGSNSGNREENILFAIKSINNKIGKVQFSAKYFENAAQGFESDTLFLNTCIQIQTELSPIALLVKIKEIELELGRQPKSSKTYESRPIDIDIILYGDEVISTADLTIPHPHFRKRDFVLIPLSEIAPGLIDPISSLTILQLLHLIKS